MKNMSRLVKVVPVLLAVAAVSVSCGNNAKVNGVVSQSPSSEVVVKVLDVNKMTVADTVATDADGKFSFKLPVQKGNPEFVYIFKGDRKIASLLLDGGDKVKVIADTLGHYTVEGSEETDKLIAVEKEFASVKERIEGLASEYSTLKPGSSEAAELQRRISQEYIAYYRSSVRYVMENSHSLTVVPVLFQKFSENLPVFSQSTDAIHFSNVCDSLESVYPDSKYLKALRNEAASRKQYLEFESRLKGAVEIGYPDIELPGIDSRKIRLSGLDARVVMVQFWTASDAKQKMFNQDVLKPIYNEYHKKGFEIYQVSLDVDKPMWASVVKEQNMPWISVCDARGSSSPYTGLYNVPALPATYIISNGELVDGKVVDSKSLRALLDRLLK